MNTTRKTIMNESSETRMNGTTFSFLSIDYSEQETDRIHNNVNHSVILGFLIAIMVIGFIGNVAVMYIIASDRRLHRAPFYFIVCMSVTDLSKTIFCLPFALSVVYHGFRWIHGQQVCTVLAFSSSFFSVSTSIGLLAAAIDRYLSMTSPRFYNKCSHGLVNLSVIILGWGVAFCLSFPPIFEQGAYKFMENEMQCTFNHQRYRENDTLGYTISFTCVLAVVLFLHIRLFSFLRSHRRMAPLYHEPARSANWTFFGPGANGQALINLLNGFTGGAPNGFTNAAQNAQQYGRVVNLRVMRNEHMTRLFFISSMAFVSTWVPYLFQIFMKVFRENVTLPMQFIVAATIVSHTHVAFCPLIYLLFGSPIRESIFDRSRNMRERHVYTGISQVESEQPEPSVRCIELEV